MALNWHKTMKIKQLSICLLSLLATACSSGGGTSGQVPLLIGTYTQGQSEGLYITDFDPETEKFGAPKLLTALDSPSFVAINRQAQRLYTVSEVQQGRVSAFQWQPGSQQLTLINTVSSQGAYPCYIALSPDRSSLAVANYASGNLAIYRLDATGAVRDQPQVLQHYGRGVDQQRQQGPHAHWVQWDSRAEFVYAVDLGTDQIKAYPVDLQTAALGSGVTAMAVAPGSGPRHMAFHPNGEVVYILNELASTVVVASREKTGQLLPLQTLSTLPQTYKGHNQSAHIYLTADGNFLYTSNRGHNSIAVFAVSASGRLQLLQTSSTHGDWPRHFTVLEQHKVLLVANQKSNSITALKIGNGGKLSFNGSTVDIAEPVFLAPAFQ